VNNACQLDLLGRVDPQAKILRSEATRLRRLTHSKPRVDAYFDWPTASSRITACRPAAPLNSNPGQLMLKYKAIDAASVFSKA
jgi:hypothetical protein